MRYFISCLLGLLIIGLFTGNSQAQLITLRGTVIDQSTGTPLPYSTLTLKQTPRGVIANAEGMFEIKIPLKAFAHEVLRISCIGYYSLGVELSTLDTAAQQVFYLKEHPYELSEVLIVPQELTADQLVDKAMAKIPENYPTTPYQLKTFYRHYCKEGSTYGRLIEAAVTLYDKKGFRKTYEKASAKYQLRVDELRRTYDFTSMYSGTHLPISLNNVIEDDLISFEGIWYKKRSEYTFHFVDTTYYDNRLVWVVEAKFRPKAPTKIRYYIAADDLAFLKIAYEYEFMSAYRHPSSQGRLEETMRHESVVTYRYHEGKYYFGHCLDEGTRVRYEFDTYEKLVEKDTHQHHIELMTNEIITDKVKGFRGKEPDRTELAKMAYHPEFWESYSVLKATPLENRIVADLAARMPLEDQYEESYQNSGLLSFTHAASLEQMLKPFWDKPIYLQFYDRVNMKKLNAARKLGYNYARSGIMFFFVYVDRDGKGLPAIIKKQDKVMRSGMLVTTPANSPLLKSYGITELPAFRWLESGDDVRPAAAPDEDLIHEEITTRLGE
ncbi:MAG: carboxypeptidase-like regulatory domain-containing protein [Bacteroidota bacterium]